MLLTDVLPRVRVEEIEGVGHMAPVTHPEKVNPVIEGFLQGLDREHAPHGEVKSTDLPALNTEAEICDR